MCKYLDMFKICFFVCKIKSCQTETMKLKDDFAKFHAAFFADGSWGLPRQLTNDMNEESVAQPEEKMPLEEIVSFCLQGFLGALQRKKIQKIRDYYGSGWIKVSHGFFRKIVPK